MLEFGGGGGKGIEGTWDRVFSRCARLEYGGICLIVASSAGVRGGESMGG